MKKLLVPFGFMLYFSACTFQAELPTKPYPFVETLPPIADSTGVTFYGRVVQQSSESIIQYVFSWGLSQTPTLTDKLVLVDSIQPDGSFSVKVRDDLLHSNYWVRAVLITKDYDVYGKSIKFLNTYVSNPEVTDIHPRFGYPGDKIVIKGKNLVIDGKTSKIFFGSYTLPVESFSNDSLVVRFPLDYIPVKSNLKLLLPGRDTLFLDSLEMRFPWSIKKNFPYLYYLPASFSWGNYGYFINRGSWFMYVYEPAKERWTTRLLPMNSGGVFSQTKVDTSGIFTSEETKLLAYSAGDKVYVFLSGAFWEYTPAADTWVRKADYPGTLSDLKRRVFGFFMNGKFYLGNCGGIQQFWEFNPSLNTWTQKADFPDAIPYLEVFGSFAFSLGETGYVGVTCNPQVCNLFTYNPTSNQWIRKKNVPLGNLVEFSGFVINDVGYAGLGNMTNGIFNNLLQYDETSDTWKKCRMNPYWGDLNVNAWIVANNKAYLYVSSYNFNYLESNIIEFDPSMN